MASAQNDNKDECYCCFILGDLDPNLNLDELAGRRYIESGVLNPEDPDFPAIHFHETADVLLFFFRVTNRKFFDAIKTKLPKSKLFTNWYSTDKALLVIGTNIDNRDGNSVQTKEGEELAKDCKAFKYIECSINKESFEGLIIDATKAVKSLKLRNDAKTAIEEVTRETKKKKI